MKTELCNKDSDCDRSDDFHNGPNLNAFVENCPKKIITPKRLLITKIKNSESNANVCCVGTNF
jgi:hypothetical protein